MNISKATRLYEAWLARFTTLDAPDIKLKHRLMASEVFPFLRATFYRWVELFPTVCQEEHAAPVVLAVGDLHVENFGTWRDREARLVWGINDFDEAAHLPYTADLVRLAASAILAAEASHLRISPADACGAILAGYRTAMQEGGRPFVLAEDHAWLREIAVHVLRDPATYWKKLADLPPPEGGVPETADSALRHALPQEGLRFQTKHRIAGLGSLGHPRFTAVAEYAGGKIAREAKALVPSSVVWARQQNEPPEIYYQAILYRAVRCADPFTQLAGHWIVRRLAPDCARIELSSLPEDRAEAELLHAMGYETANIHFGSAEAVKEIRQDLKKRGGRWLERAAARMAVATKEDWQEWQRLHAKLSGPAPAESAEEKPAGHPAETGRAHGVPGRKGGKSGRSL